jgi:hypothetical protein
VEVKKNPFRAFVVPDPLEPVEQRAALGDALERHRRRPALEVGVGVVDAHPLDAQRLADPLAGDHLSSGLALDREHLEPAATRQLARVTGPEAVEPTVVAIVLGLVHEAGPRIGGHGLVREAAHARDRRRLLRAIGGGTHEVAVAVLLGPSVVGPLHGLLAGDPPDVTERDPAGAVGERAGEADELTEDPAPPGVEHHRDVAAHAQHVVLRVVRGLHRALDGPRVRADLVVPDQQCGVVVPPEGGHAVVRDRHRRPVAHDVPDLRERDVPEAVREGQDLVAVLIGGSASGP